MSRARLLWRAVLAVLLTGLFSPVFFAAMSWVVGAWDEPWLWSRGGLEFIFIVSMFGTGIAVPAAAILGLVVERSKAAWLGRRPRGGFLAHLLLSIVGGVAIILAWCAATRILYPPTFDTAAGPSAWWEIAGWESAGIVGGACSALFWWLLVIVPMRRARLIEQ